MKKRIIVTSWIIIMSLILPCIVFAGSVMLTWEASTEPDIAGYRVYYGTSSRVYGPSIPVSDVLTIYTVSELEQGMTYYFSVTAVDTSGNESGYSIERTVTISNAIAPTVAITSPTTAGTYDTEDALITISGKASDNVGVSRVIWANSAGGSGTASGTETWSISDISLVEGENIVTVTAADAAGHQNSTFLTVTYTVTDAIAPTIAITSPTTAGTYDTEDALITISGKASDNVGVSRVTWVNSAGGSGTASGTETWSISDISLVEGENIVTVTAADAAGHQNSTFLTVTYTLSDTIAPTIAITSPTTAGTYETADALITISGNALDNVGVISVTWFSSGSGSGTAIGTETWSISNIELVEGKNIITIWAKDAAGNDTGATLTVTYYTPPQLISDLQVASDTTYEVVDGLDNGSKAYVDSNLTYSNLPDILKNATYIKTSINDRTSTTKPFIGFIVNKDVIVCLAYDDRIEPKPSWLPVKMKTKATLTIGNEVMSIYAQFLVRAGKKVRLGGNGGDINSNMYTIIIVEK